MLAMCLKIHLVETGSFIKVRSRIKANSAGCIIPQTRSKVISNNYKKKIIRTKVNMTQKRLTFFKQIPSMLQMPELLYPHVLVKKLFLQKTASKSSNRRKVEILPEGLGGSNRRSGNLPKGNSSENQFQLKTAGGSFIRDRKPLEKGCNNTTGFCRITTRGSIC